MKSKFTLIVTFMFFACSEISHDVEIARNSMVQSYGGMKWIAGGTYTQGAHTPGEYPREYPPHVVKLSGFFIDSTEVTNDQFRIFVGATGYCTLAERSIDWAEMNKQLPVNTPKPHDSLLAPGSMVFTPPKEVVSLSNFSSWWQWKSGVSWQHPEGPGSDLSNRSNHPVVHIALSDAQAYCRWRSARLPTEAEWEYAARGGLEGERYSWGNEDPIANPLLTNIWQGDFPYKDLALDGFAGNAPVGSFPPNNYGLYDMSGNVWEWCSDRFHEHYYKSLVSKNLCENPQGPSSGYDPREPWANNKHVIKGGSYLCHVSYCENYRPSAREAGAADTGMPHLGFRCVRDSMPQGK